MAEGHKQEKKKHGPIEEEDSEFEKAQHKVAQYFHLLMRHVVEHSMQNEYIYGFMLVIEMNQLLYYMINSRIPQMWDNPVIDVLRTIQTYTQVDQFFFQEDATTFFGAIYICCVVEFFFVLLVAICLRMLMQGKDPKTSQSLTFFLKALSICVMLFNTVLTVPFLEAAMVLYNCKPGIPMYSMFNCYQGIFLAELLPCVLQTAFTLFLLVLISLYYIDFNPFSPRPFAGPEDTSPLWRLLPKIALPFQEFIDYSASLSQQLEVLGFIYFLYQIIKRYTGPHYYNRYVEIVSLCCDATMCWMGLCGFMQVFFDSYPPHSIGSYYFLFGAPLAGAALNKLVYDRKNTFYERQVRELRKPEDSDFYVNVLIPHIRNINSPVSKIYLSGVLSQHIKYCHRRYEMFDPCTCTLLQDEKAEPAVMVNNWYLFLQTGILKPAIERNPKSARLYLLNAYLLHEKLNNPYKALLELMKMKQSQPNLQEEFAHYCLWQTIEEEMQDEKLQPYVASVDFQIVFQKFKTCIANCVEAYNSFYKELIEEIPDVQKLTNIGYNLKDQLVEVDELFNEQLMALNPYNIECMTLYAYFLHDILNNEAESREIFEKAELCMRNLVAISEDPDYFTANNNGSKESAQDYTKFIKSEETCVLICSGNWGELGIIQNCNEELTRILGYAKSEVVEQNVSKIMPRIIADAHTSFIHDFLKRSTSKIMNRERFVPCLNKRGCIVPCQLIATLLPRLENGIEIIGFLRNIDQRQIVRKNHSGEIETTMFILIDKTRNDTITNICEQVTQVLGIHAKQVIPSNEVQELSLDIFFTSQVWIRFYG